MPHLRAFSLVVVAFSTGCAGASAPRLPSTLPVRILSSEAAAAPRPELAPREATPRREAPAPRIGAPGGSGAGSRRVVPAQSGKETVGGLPAGIGNGAGLG